MEKEIFCCDPLGSHKEIFRATKRTKDSFRKITGDFVEKSQLPLTAGLYLCSKCRPVILKHHQRSSPEEPTEANIKHVLCCNPLKLHENPKRQPTGQRFYKCPEKLVKQAEAKGLNLSQGERMCFPCRLQVMNTIGDPDSLSKFCADPRGKHKNGRCNPVLYMLKEATDEEITIAHSLGLPLQELNHLCLSCRLFLKKNRRTAFAESEKMEVDNEAVAATSSGCQQQHDMMDYMTDSRTPVTSEDESDDYTNVRVDSYCQLEKILVDLKMRPTNQSHLREGNNAGKIYIEMKKELAKLISQASGRKIPVGGPNCGDCSEHLSSLKLRYGELDKKTKKYELLTAVPAWVGESKLKETFNISHKMARKVIDMRTSHGPLTSPIAKVGKKIAPEIVKSVRDFYLSPENSRVSPNQRDVIIASRENVDGKIVKNMAAKQEILVTLKELYREYRLTHPDNKISKDKFAKLRPKQCVWGYKRGFQKTCLCIIHSNFNHLLSTLKLPEETHSQLTKFFCTMQADCLLGACNFCPKWDFVDRFLEDYPHETVECWQWAYVGEQPKRIDLVKQARSKEEFKDYFKEVALKVAEHHFIYAAQKDFIKKLKEIRPEEQDKATVFVDFGMNYSFILPQEVAGLHWSHKQATVHPFVLHYYCPKTQTTKVQVYTVISDWLTHNANSFHAFRSFILNKHIKRQFPHIKRITYVSDGPTSQYKNLYNFVNLANHTKDFGIYADWIYSAASHGKSMCDAMSALAKRLTRSESLRRTDNFILTASDMVDYLNSQNTFEDRTYVFISEETAKTILEAEGVEQRYQEYKPIRGTRQFHSVQPLSSTKIRCRKFAKSTLNYDFEFSKRPRRDGRVGASFAVGQQGFPGLYPDLQTEFLAPSAPPLDLSMITSDRGYKVGDYVATLLNEAVVLGIVVEFNEEDSEYAVKLLQKLPRGDGYKFKDPEKIITLVEEDILCHLPVPITPTGRSYIFDEGAIINANGLAEQRIRQLKG